MNENGKNAPAPWPVFTRAGCDMGAFSLNGLAIENKTDIANIFGSTIAASAATQDYEGIAIHCAKGSPLCNSDACVLQSNRQQRRQAQLANQEPTVSRVARSLAVESTR